MQKQLIQQVSQAMKANADTIDRQNYMLDNQEHTIKRLKASLTALAETQAQELKELPTMFEALRVSLNENTEEQKVWWQNQKEHAQKQTELAAQLITLANIQLQLTTALKQYQVMLVPADDLESDMSALETMLESTMAQLKSSQSAIQQSQNKLTTELEWLRKLTSN